MSGATCLKQALATVALTMAALVVVADADGPVVQSADGTDAVARIGRPGTPRSVAGVARRTSRRVTGRAVGGAVAYPGTIYALPGGCGPAVGGIYQCGRNRYRAYYDGPTVVYRPYL